MRYGLTFLAMLVAAPGNRGKGLDLTDDLSITGYVDARLFAPTDQKSWLQGGLGKFRYGVGPEFRRRSRAAGELAASTDDLICISVLRAEPETPSVVDALETYLRYAPAAEGDFLLVGEGRRLLSHHQSGE